MLHFISINVTKLNELSNRKRRSCTTQKTKKIKWINCKTKQKNNVKLKKQIFNQWKVKQ